MMAVALLALVVNVLSVSLLRRRSEASLNVRGAYLEVLSDCLASLGVIVAGAVMWATGWYYADPLVSAGIALFILPRTWHLLREAVGVLLEGTPADVNLEAVRTTIAETPGVASVHDLHVWTLTTGLNALSAHVVLAPGASHGPVLGAVRGGLSARFQISHSTLQIEGEGCGDATAHL